MANMSAYRERLHKLPRERDLNALVEELEDVKRLAAGLRERIEELKMRARASTHLAAFPPELLLEIFTHLAAVEPIGELTPMTYAEGDNSDGDTDYSYDDDDTDGTFTDSSSSFSSEQEVLTRLGWSKVTHVCTRWRQIAVNASSLWSVVPLDLPLEWLDTIIARAGRDSPLDFIVPVETDLTFPDAGIILRVNLHRARSLLLSESLQLSHSITAPLWLEAEHTSGNPADVLEKLSLCLETDRLSLLPRRMMLSPRLKEADLHILSWPREPNLFTKLTSLSITCQGISEDFRPPREDIRALLRSLLNVRTLRIEQIYGMEAEHPEDGTIDTIHLPHLRELFVSGWKDPLRTIVTALVLRDISQMSLHLPISYQAAEGDAVIEGYLRRSGFDRLLKLSHHNHVQSLSIMSHRLYPEVPPQGQPKDLHVTSWLDPALRPQRICPWVPTDANPYHGCAADPDFYFDGILNFPDRGLPTHMHILDGILKLTNLQHLRSLSLDSMDELLEFTMFGSDVTYGPDEWMNALRSAGNLEHLRLALPVKTTVGTKTSATVSLLYALTVTTPITVDPKLDTLNESEVDSPEGTDTGDQEAVEIVLFPGLRNLYLVNIYSSLQVIGNDFTAADALESTIFVRTRRNSAFGVQVAYTSAWDTPITGRESYVEMWKEEGRLHLEQGVKRVLLAR